MPSSLHAATLRSVSLDIPLPRHGRGSIVTTGTPNPACDKTKRGETMSIRATKRSGRSRRLALFTGIAVAASVIPAAAQASANSAAAEKPVRGGNITVGIFDQVLTTCYSPNVPNSALGVLKTVYEGLVEKSSDGKFVPFLAKTIAPSADFKSWTMTLRPGIKFSNGEPLDAAAVVLNLQALSGDYYLKNTATAVHTAGSGIPFTANLRKVEATGTDTVVMTLWTSQVDWLDTLYASGRFFMRAPSTIKNKDECATKGVGTGPFMFDTVTPTNVKVKRNPGYWRKDKAGTQLPYLESITFDVQQQPTQRLNALRSGKYAAAQFTSAGEVKQILSVKSSGNLGSIDSKDSFYPTWWPNQAIEPFNNKNARLAFAHAWDNATYYKLRNCFKGKCLGNIPTSIVGKDNVMYNTKGYLKFDIKKSKEYQEAYKKETGKDLTFQINATLSDESLNNAKAAQQIFAKAGITTTINQEDGATQVANAFPGLAAAAAGKLNPYQAYAVLLFEGEGTGFILPFLQQNVFSEPGNNARTERSPLLPIAGTALNVTRHKDNALTDLLYAAKQDITKARPAKLKALTKYVQENAVVVPTPTLTYTYGFGKKLRGYDTFELAAGKTGIPMTNAGINWTGIWVSK
jgi:peptide/nickel transport system substrate-binding protein